MLHSIRMFKGVLQLWIWKLKHNRHSLQSTINSLKFFFFEKTNGTEPKTASNIQINMNGTLSRIFRTQAQYLNTHFFNKLKLIRMGKL